MRRFKSLSTIVAFVLPALATDLALAHAQGVAFAPSSRIRIEGTTNVGPWSCQSRAFSGQVEPSPPPFGDLTVAVRSLDCGNGMMNKDLFAALKSAAFPAIRFRAASYDVIRPVSESSAGHYMVHGSLEIAGVERPFSLAVSVSRMPGSVFRAAGSAKIRMSDFGVEPPRALLGTIRARDDVTVSFAISPAGAQGLAALAARAQGGVL